MKPLLLCATIVSLAAVQPHARQSVEPRADEQLRKMDQYLRSLQSLRVDSRAVDEVVTKAGQKLQFVSGSHVSVRRPNRLRSDRLGPVADITFRYDGKQFTLFGK